MPSRVSFVDLSDDTAWATIQGAMDPDGKALIVRNTLQYLRQQGAVGLIQEHEYLDRDYSAEFSAFYSTLFKRHSKICERFHFFSTRVAQLESTASAADLSEAVQNLENSYLGYVVIRPVRHAPLSKAVLKAPGANATLLPNVLVRADYAVHLLGAELHIVGAPVTQQDSRVFACAQAAIWTAARHFHVKHRGPWYSSVEITAAASKPTDTILSQSLPAGSGFLSLDNMVRALRAAGREPFAYMGRIASDKFPYRAEWAQSLRPREIIHRYVDSGIPVILGLLPWQQDMSVGHAVVVVGHVVRTLPAGAGLPEKPTRAEFCHAFLVNDDQLGSYRMMGIESSTDPSDVPYNVDQHVRYILIPLPNKVFLTAEKAEKIAWDLLDFHAANWAALKNQLRAFLSADDLQYADQFVTDHLAKRVVARTYLTYGWKYKRRIVRNSAAEIVKQVALRSDLPRYVWVTEFGYFNSLNHLAPANRRVVGHAVTDATSSDHSSPHLLFHVPGAVSMVAHDPANPYGPYIGAIVPVPGDTEYFPKVRGVDVIA